MENLKEAVEFLKESGIDLYAVNKSYPEEQDEIKGSVAK